jgi:hypothetical protein
MMECVVHYQNVAEVCNGCCRDMNRMSRFIVRMSHICTGHAVHYQNVAKTFKIKSEAVIITH